MKTSAPIIAIGAIVLLSAFSKKSSTDSKSSSKSKDESTSEGGGGTGTVKKTGVGGSGVGGLKPNSQVNPQECGENQFYNTETKKCEPFWVDGFTEEKVIEQFGKIINEFQLGGDINKICVDVYVNGEAQQNQFAIDIIRKTISDLWVIPISYLPPKPNDPEWLKTVWKKVIDLYYKKVCNF